MRNLLTVIACHNKDLDQAQRLVGWIGELNVPPRKVPAPLLIVVDQTVSPERYTALHEEGKKVFSHVRTITVSVLKQGWPSACDTMFMSAARYVRDNYTLPFLWLEPDCVPLKPEWFEELKGAYNGCNMRYLGAVIEQSGQKGMPAKHLTGCSVYPNDSFDDFDKMPEVTSGRQPWDIAGGERIATAAQNTPLIQHFWGGEKTPPVFVESRAPDAPGNYVMLDFLKPEAVLFHRDKPGNLIPLLRKFTMSGVPISKTAEKPSENMPPNTPQPAIPAVPSAPPEITDAELEKLTAPEIPAPISDTTLT